MSEVATFPNGETAVWVTLDPRSRPRASRPSPRSVVTAVTTVESDWLCSAHHRRSEGLSFEVAVPEGLLCLV